MIISNADNYRSTGLETKNLIYRVQTDYDNVIQVNHRHTGLNKMSDI